MQNLEITEKLLTAVSGVAGARMHACVRGVCECVSVSVCARTCIHVHAGMYVNAHTSVCVWYILYYELFIQWFEKKQSVNIPTDMCHQQRSGNTSRLQ